MDSSLNISEFLELIRKRSDVLAVLSDHSSQPRDLVDELDISRSTVTRALRTLEEHELVEKKTGGYAATGFGKIASHRFENYRNEIEALISTKPLMQAFPDSEPPPPELIDGAEITLRTQHGAFRPLQVITDVLQGEDGDVIAYFPTIINPNLPRAWYQTVVEADNDAAIVVSEETYDQIKPQYVDELAAIATKPDSSVYTYNGPPFGLVCIDTGDHFTVLIIIYSHGSIEGTICNQSIKLHKWVKGMFDQIRSEATSKDDELRELGSSLVGTTTRADGASITSSQQTAPGTKPVDLPRSLVTQGFRRLTAESSESTTESTISLNELVSEDATVQRGPPAEDGDVVDHILKELRSGSEYLHLSQQNGAICGQCGKVAAQWIQSQEGTVLYRESRKGGLFDAATELESYLRKSPDRTLVIVEDAIRDDADSIFNIIAKTRDTDDVAFLLHAKEDEWDGLSGTQLGATESAYVRSRLTIEKQNIS